MMSLITISPLFSMKLNYNLLRICHELLSHFGYDLPIHGIEEGNAWRCDDFEATRSNFHNFHPAVLVLIGTNISWSNIDLRGKILIFEKLRLTHQPYLHFF